MITPNISLNLLKANVLRIQWLLIFLGLSFSNAQTETRWQDHFSYNKVIKVLEVDGLLYAASENGLFTYDLSTGEVSKLSKVNGLNDVDITSMAYNPDNDLVLISYESGELDLIGTDEIFNFLEIPLDDFNGSKRVNHLTSEGRKMLMSTDFGVVTFDLIDLEFDETSFFSIGGSFLQVRQSAILNGQIYAATNQGIYTHPLDDFIANFPNWQQPAGVPTSSFSLMETFASNIIAYAGNTLWRFDGSNWSTIGTFNGLVDLNANGNRLSLTSASGVTILDESFSSVGTFSSPEDQLNAAISSNSIIFAGTEEKGLINANTSEEIKPDGPFNNIAWSVTADQGIVYISPGGLRSFAAPLGFTFGVYYFDGTSWNHLESADLNGARDFVHVTIDPTDPDTAYASTWSNADGIFKIVNGELEIEYDQNNSLLRNVSRIGGSVFDNNGDLWLAQSFVLDDGASNGLIKIDSNGAQEYFSLASIDIGGGGVNPPIYSNGYVLVPGTRGDGVQILNTQTGNVFLISSNGGEGSLPTNNIRSLAVDQSNRLWICTIEGLRVLSDPFTAVESGSFETEPIVIVQNGIPEELFIQTQLNSIAVDEANRKWIGLESGGVFYLSDDGTETILNFTTSNSPLPSNIVYSISIDSSTGRVYFATDSGVVSYQSDVTTTGDSFGNINVFPNPVRPGFNGNVTITGLPNNANVKITDVVGNLIFETRAEGGVAEWNTRNFNGQLVASGIYLVLMTNFDGSSAEFTKVAIVR